MFSLTLYSVAGITCFLFFFFFRNRKPNQRKMEKVSRKQGYAQFIENIVMNIIFQNLLFLSIYSSIFIFIRWNKFSDVC